MHSCTICDWSIGPDEQRSIEECNERAIQHYLETSHTVVHQSFHRQAMDSQPSLTMDRL